MKDIGTTPSTVYADDHKWEAFRGIVQELNPSKVFVLVDENTHIHCNPFFQKHFTDYSYAVIQIPAGEIHKNIETCVKVWQELSNQGADRKSLLINLGGGMVTDLGGFVASTYQRGIAFINIPTSLLAMVDASVGGKNGVDLGVLKNQIGIIRQPNCVLIEPQFLKTLPAHEIRSGQAEIIKHGLISSEMYLDKSFQLDVTKPELAKDLIWESILIKHKIVQEDPFEKGIRKTLNYGHTLGHAIESYCLQSDTKETLLHGEAIAIGLLLENYISTQLLGFSKDDNQQVATKIKSIYKSPTFSEDDVNQIIKLLIHDKKNTYGKVQFVLLTSIGNCKLNCTVENDLIKEAFKYYHIF